MHKTAISLGCAAVCALAPFARTQDDMGMPKPAPELAKLEPLIGNWAGKGTFHEPQAGPSGWKATGGYRWSHDGFWVREDFTIHFEGMDQPMVMRTYIGWDAENKRYVTVHASNNGEVGIDELHLLPDGTMSMLAVREMNGAPYAERANSRIEGGKMTMNIDFLMPQGGSMSIVEGVFVRSDEAAPEALAAASGSFGAPPPEEMKAMVRGVGDYDVKGTMTMAPGAPEMQIRGQDTWRALFGGAVLHGHTDGEAEGMPGKYESDVFYGYDKKRRCYVGVFVSNMGEVGKMDMWFGADGDRMINTSAGTMQGQPMVQRFVLELAADGSFESGVGHTIMGDAPPMESFKATFTKKK